MNHSRRILSCLLLLSLIGTSWMGSACRTSKQDTQQGSNTPSESTDLTSNQATESSSENTSSSENSASIQVKTDWSKYTPKPQEKDVYTRLSDQTIYDFQPSDEYGAIFPFVGAEYIYLRGENSYHNKSGLVDVSGRIVCDPVFDGIFPVTNGYILSKSSETSTLNRDRKYGFASLDGSFYTGLIFDECTYDSKQKQILFISCNDTGITVSPFDCTRLQFDTSYNLLVNHSPRGIIKEELLYNLLDIRSNRYVVIELMDEYLICDGSTGEWIELNIEGSDDSHSYFQPEGDLIIYRSYDESAPEDMTTFYTLLNQDFEPVSDQRFYCIEQLANGKCFLETADEYMIVDANLQPLIQITKEDMPPHEITIYGNYIVEAKDNGEIAIFDDQLNLIQSVATDPDSFSYASFLEPNYLLKEYGYEFDYDDILLLSLPDRTELHNLDNQTNTTLENDLNLTLLPDRILVTYGEWEHPFWRLLDSEDYHLIAEGSGSASPYVDEATNICYLMIFPTDEHAGDGTIVSITTGETVTTIPMMREDVSYTIIQDFYDGKLVQMGQTSDYFLDSIFATRILDQDGNIVFLYHPLKWYDD